MRSSLFSTKNVDVTICCFVFDIIATQTHFMLCILHFFLLLFLLESTFLFYFNFSVFVSLIISDFVLFVFPFLIFPFDFLAFASFTRFPFFWT